MGELPTFETRLLNIGIVDMNIKCIKSLEVPFIRTEVRGKKIDRKVLRLS